MTATSKRVKEQIKAQWQKPHVRRWGALGAAGLAIGLVGFYAVSDSARLEQHVLLDGADWLGSGVCHRLTEHSFSIGERQLPLCARCTGMYLGVFLSLVAFWLKGRLRRTELPPWPILLTLLGFIGLMAVDGLNSFLHFFANAPHLYPPQNWLRLLTGLGTGLAMGSFVFPALAQTLWQRYTPLPMLASWGDLFHGLLLASSALLLAWSNLPVVLYVLALVSTAGLVMVLAAVNGIMGLILLRLDGRARDWSETAVPLTVSILLAILELSAIGFLRYNLTGTMTGFPGL